VQILRNTPATLELLVYQSGVLIDLDSTPTVVVTDANGASVTTGSVSKPGSTTGTYRSTLPPQADLKTLKVVWSGALSSDPVEFTQQHEIVGDFLFIEADARGYTVTGQQTPLSSETNYPDAAIARMRELITDQFEQRTGRSWVSRYCRTELHGTGSRELSLRDGHPLDADGRMSGGPGRHYDIQRLISVSIAGVAQTVGDYTLHGRKVVGPTTWPRASWDSLFNVVIEYEYGVTPTNLEAEENGLRMAVANLVPSDLSAYAMTAAAAGESISFPQQSGGLVWPPKVWEWLKANPARRIPSVA
jgi:hypothetical protein